MATVRIGDIFKTVSCGECEVIGYNNARDVDVRFLLTGYVKNTTASALRKGNVKDPLFPSVFGVGYIGIGHHTSGDVLKKSRHNKCHETWLNMMYRCYQPTCEMYEAYGGRGVTVCEEWHNFQNFADFYYKNYKDGWKLDKDVLNKGNLVYSEENCCFLPEEINALFISRRSDRGKYPIGVYYNQGKGYFVAQVMVAGGKRKSKSFKNPEDAFLWYKGEKEDRIKEVAEKYAGDISEDVYNKLMRWNVEVTD